MTATLRYPVTALDHAAGPPDATVTLVEYGDYQCPYCGMAHPIVQAMQERLGDRLRFVFRNFPLTEIHPRALRAALAAESVGAQRGEGAFWRMHDAIFEHQRALHDEHLAAYAEESGADAGSTLADIETQAQLRRVEGDFASGVRSGVNGTPTFFINGVRYDGDWRDVKEFAVALERAAEGAMAR